MDPQLRQRLLGACVLVALAVLLVPVLLDGGYRETALNRRDLGPMPADDFPEQATGPSDDVLAAIDAGLDATAEEGAAAPDAAEAARPPGSVAGTAPTAPPDQPRASAAQPSVSAPPAKARAATADAPAAPRALAPEARWAVQIAAFSAREKAEALVKRLLAAGYKAYILEAREAGGTLYRVRAGPLPERGAALALRDRLAANPEFRGALVRE